MFSCKEKQKEWTRRRGKYYKNCENCKCLINEFETAFTRKGRSYCIECNDKEELIVEGGCRISDLFKIYAHLKLMNYRVVFPLQYIPDNKIEAIQLRAEISNREEGKDYRVLLCSICQCEYYEIYPSSTSIDFCTCGNKILEDIDYFLDKLKIKK